MTNQSVIISRWVLSRVGSWSVHSIQFRHYFLSLFPLVLSLLEDFLLAFVLFAFIRFMGTDIVMDMLIGKMLSSCRTSRSLSASSCSRNFLTAVWGEPKIFLLSAAIPLSNNLSVYPFSLGTLNNRWRRRLFRGDSDDASEDERKQTQATRIACVFIVRLVVLCNTVERWCYSVQLHRDGFVRCGNPHFCSRTVWRPLEDTEKWIIIMMCTVQWYAQIASFFRGEFMRDLWMECFEFRKLIRMRRDFGIYPFILNTRT